MNLHTFTFQPTILCLYSFPLFFFTVSNAYQIPLIFFFHSTLFFAQNVRNLFIFCLNYIGSFFVCNFLLICLLLALIFYIMLNCGFLRQLKIKLKKKCQRNWIVNIMKSFNLIFTSLNWMFFTKMKNLFFFSLSLS